MKKTNKVKCSKCDETFDKNIYFCPLCDAPSEPTKIRGGILLGLILLSFPINHIAYSLTLLCLTKNTPLFNIIDNLYSNYNIQIFIFSAIFCGLASLYDLVKYKKLVINLFTIIVLIIIVLCYIIAVSYSLYSFYNL